VVERWEIDDVVGAVPARSPEPGDHCGGPVRQFARMGHRPDCWGQLQIRLPEPRSVSMLGVAYVLFSCLNKVYPLRVSAEDERIGLNMDRTWRAPPLLDLSRRDGRPAQPRRLFTHVSNPIRKVGNSPWNTTGVLDTVKYRVPAARRCDRGASCKQREHAHDH
jgi:Amt family ammonium transporter